jgi:hypothetical protein
MTEEKKKVEWSHQIDCDETIDWLIPTKQVAEFLSCSPDTVKRRSDRDEGKRNEGDASAFPPVLYLGRRGMISFLDFKHYYNYLRKHRDADRPDLAGVRDAQKKIPPDDVQ